MATKIVKETPPIGSIIFLDESDENPAVSYPGTAWEPVVNNIYYVTEGKQEYLPDGTFKLPFQRPNSWRRIK